MHVYVHAHASVSAHDGDRCISSFIQLKAVLIPMLLLLLIPILHVALNQCIIHC